MEKSKNCFTNFFKMFDYFGVNFTFKIKNETNYKTNFGGQIFLLFLILANIYFFLLFSDFWNRKIFNVNNSFSVNTPAPKINFNDSSFNLGYSLLYENNSVLDPKTIGLSLKLYLSTILNNDVPNKIRNKIITRNCQTSDFFTKNKNDSFTSLFLNNYLCAIVNDSIEIEGTFTDSKYQYLELSVSIDDNIFQKGNLSIIKYFLDHHPLKLNVYWTDGSFDMANYSDPISNFLHSYLMYIDIFSIKKVNLDFAKIQFSSDDNMILQRPVNLTRVAFKEDFQYSYYTNNRTALQSGNTLVKLFFRSSPSITQIDRSYQKLNTFFANFGGIMSNMLLGLYFFVSFINQFWAEQDVMNKILKFREQIKIIHPKELDLMKKSFNKGQLNNKTCEHQINDKSENYQEKVSNEKAMIDINEAKSKEYLESNLQNFNPLSKNKNIEIELNELSFKDETFNNYNKRKSIDALKERIISQSNNEVPRQINTDHKLSFESQRDFNNENKIIKTIIRKESFHHIKLKEREGIISIDKAVEKIYANSKSKKAINFNCFDIFLRNFCWKSESMKFMNILYEKANKKLLYYFDAYSYVRKMQEIDILKYLLLDKDQINLFKFLSKPTISKSYSDSDDIYQNIQKNQEFHDFLINEDIHEIVLSYFTIKDKKDDINKKLFYLFDYEIDNILID